MAKNSYYWGGQLGAAVASNLLKEDVPVVLFDISGDKNCPVPLKDKIEGASWASSAKEAAEQADVVITALPRPEHVTAAFSGDDGILEGLRPGSVWIEHSTTDFTNTEKVRSLVEAKGASAIEAPLTGGMQILREGKMVAFVGAEEKVLDDMRSLIELSAPRIVRCGEFGHATILKVYSNVLCALHDVGIAETLVVCKKAGMDMKLVFDAIRVSAGNSYCWESEVPRMLRGDYYPDFTAEMMAKDISLGLDLGQKYGVPQPTYEYVAGKYEEAMQKFGRDSGSAIPCRLIEEATDCYLIEGEGKEDIYPGNSINYDSHGGAFKDWSYTTKFIDGSYAVVHTGYDNVYEEFEEQDRKTQTEEIASLRLRVAELEKELEKTKA
eukprot:CAMPEP_0184021018 /NCGR_PEP_ID=MMETSP0954-20121128/9679_1 /TAXON_ID=627963 /ORGANISM="Aplanochytrium sp, Strain PBS07" /LENGTH=380 /DNA_ID=CAMNT_0026302959 /DNA_START=128 /DNA_END=1271 /DNA_ORIENTATION=-